MENANEEVENALVDAKWRERETAASGYVNESPTPQWRVGREGAPVGAREGRERETERGIWPGRIVMSRGA